MVKVDKTFEEAIEIGKDNARLWPEVVAWCRHIEIECHASGALAAVHRLPIGLFACKCPHSDIRRASPRVDIAAESFIVESCRDCRHHDEERPTQFGREVLRRSEQDRLRSEELEAVSLRLARDAHETLRDALETQIPTTRSINKLILAALDPIEPASTQRPLADAAKLAPELFTEDAINAIMHGLREDKSAEWFQVAEALYPVERALPTRWKSELLELISQGSDAACGLIATHIESLSGDLPVEDLVEACLELAEYNHRGVMAFHPEYPGATRLIAALIEDDAEVVQARFGSRLRINSKREKLTAARLLTDLVEQRPGFVLELTESLLNCLEYEDTTYGESADRVVGRLLAHCLAVDPEHVFSKLHSFDEGASREARELLVDVYDAVCAYASPEGSWASHSRQLPREAYLRGVDGAFEDLLARVADLRNTPKHRLAACKALVRAGRSFPERLLKFADRLVPRLVMVEREIAALQAPETLESVFRLSTDRLHLDRLMESLSQLTGVAAASQGDAGFRFIQAALQQLDAQSTSRARLVEALKPFARDGQLTPNLVPLLYSLLQDVESAEVRRAAVEVFGVLRNAQPQNIPSNMTDLVVVYLGDPDRYVRHAAASALRFHRFSAEQAPHALQTLRSQVSPPVDDIEVEAAASFLLTGFPHDEAVAHETAAEIVPWLCSTLRSPYRLDGILQTLMYVAERSSPLCGHFIRAIIVYYTRFPGRLSDKSEFLDRLKRFEPTLLRQHIAGLSELADNTLNTTPAYALRIAELLVLKGLWQPAEAVSVRVLETLDDVRANSFVRRHVGTLLWTARFEIARLGQDRAQANTAIRALQRLLVAAESDE